ncbi:hypothetical protein ACH5RR_016962 [Cinchona calisaya]|uniref:Uncharacterized protein n=1 Tax=Cinchona calisaya TaxID=153742 RepID=A0ABD2ZXV7_9GENT
MNERLKETEKERKGLYEMETEVQKEMSGVKGFINVVLILLILLRKSTRLVRFQRLRILLTWANSLLFPNRFCIRLLYVVLEQDYQLCHKYVVLSHEEFMGKFLYGSGLYCSTSSI